MEQLELVPSVAARPAKAGAKSGTRLRARQTRETMARLTRDATHLCEVFQLQYRALEPERAGVKSRYGACFSDGTIKIRLYHATTGRTLRYSSLIDTLCHELAHLRHFNHGPRFKVLYQRILAYARSAAIYRPKRRDPYERCVEPARAPRPRNQLALFW